MNCGSLVAVFTTKNPLQAEIVRVGLENNNILAVVSGGRQAGLTGAMDIDVLVRAEDAVRAREFLAEHLASGIGEQELEEAGWEGEKNTGDEAPPEAR